MESLKLTVSQVRPLTQKTGTTILRFHLTLSFAGVSFETHAGCIAGVGKTGPWVRPPAPMPKFQTTRWTKEFQDEILAGLERLGMLKNLGLDQWSQEDDKEYIL